MPQFNFTPQEIQALIKLIDSGVRHDGLNAAMNAAMLVQKLQNPIPPNKPQEEKDKK